MSAISEIHSALKHSEQVSIILSEEIETLKKEVLYHTKIRKDLVATIKIRDGRIALSDELDSKRAEIAKSQDLIIGALKKENEDLKKHLIVAAVMQKRGIV